MSEQKWHRTLDELPKGWAECIIWDSGAFHVARHESGGFFESCGGDYCGTPEYWMPLPPHPP